MAAIFLLGLRLEFKRAFTEFYPAGGFSDNLHMVLQLMIIISPSFLVPVPGREADGSRRTFLYEGGKKVRRNL